ncbi:MAG: hypothetical protein RR355_02465, partial [Oscillospiraceae bacterium]
QIKKIKDIASTILYATLDEVLSIANIIAMYIKIIGHKKEENPNRPKINVLSIPQSPPPLMNVTQIKKREMQKSTIADTSLRAE